MSEAADDYQHILADLGGEWRVALRPHGSLYLLQRRLGPGAAPWRSDAVNHHCDGLIKRVAARGIEPSPAAREVLLRLPRLARDAREGLQ